MENPSLKGWSIMDWWHWNKEQMDRLESSLRKGWWTPVESRVMWAVAEKRKRQQTPFWCSNYCTTNPISEFPAQNKQKRCQKKRIWDCGTLWNSLEQKVGQDQKTVGDNQKRKIHKPGKHISGCSPSLHSHPSLILGELRSLYEGILSHSNICTWEGAWLRTGYPSGHWSIMIFLSVLPSHLKYF